MRRYILWPNALHTYKICVERDQSAEFKTSNKNNEPGPGIDGTERMADNVRKEKWMRTIDNRIITLLFFFVLPTLLGSTYMQITNSLKRIIIIIFFPFMWQYKRMAAIVEEQEKKNIY